jgi:UTP--glucose-1-phosphate uridylyltransferase
MSRRAFMQPRKAIFPVAGFGSRFLPATKACPKELLPVVDRPLIQYAVEEAAAAGMRDMIFVTGRNKRAIEDHFDKAYELERELTARDDEEALRALRASVPGGVTFSYVRQPEVAGVGDALLRARALAGDEPFAMLLADDLIDAERPALAQLLDVFADERASVVAVAAAGDADTAYGRVMLDGGEDEEGARRIASTGSAAGAAPLALLGRAVLTPAIWPALVSAREAEGEASYAAGIAALLAREPVYACEVSGRRYDCGSKLGYLEAQLAYARKRPELWRDLRHSLESLIEPEGEGPRRHGTPRPAVRAS